MASDGRNRILSLIHDDLERAGLSVAELAKDVARATGGDVRTYAAALRGKTRAQRKTLQEIAHFLEERRGKKGLSATIDELLANGFANGRRRSSSTSPAPAADPRRKYLGQWISYRASLDAGARVPAIKERQWLVCQDAAAGYVVESSEVGGEKADYHGPLVLERDFCVIRLQGVEVQESILVRLHDPIPPHTDRTIGLYLCMGFGHHSIAGPIAISRDAWPEKELLECWSRAVRTVTDPRTRLTVLIDVDPDTRK